MKALLLSFLIATAPITDAIEDLSTFNYEDMAANTGSRRLLTSPVGAYYFLRAFLANVELDLTADQNLRDLMQWAIYEYCKSFERNTMELPCG